jgi:hypothetical protein
VSKFQLKDLDVFYISFDEINCDANWARVLQLNPEAKRVHGVLGFDKAHRACALASTTPRFVTIDGDNWLNDGAMEYELDDTDFPDVCFSFKSKNTLNGLAYGNGGVKVWNKEVFLASHTHELADTTDFCWNIRYYGVDFLASSTVNNCTPYQAWRAGYREGVKLGYVGSLPLDDFANEQHRIPAGNLRMLRIWTALGRESNNGIWGILGARQGLYEIASKTCKNTVINDYNAMATKWAKVENLNAELTAQEYGLLLSDDYNFPVPELDKNVSDWVKSVFPPTRREGLIL